MVPAGGKKKKEEKDGTSELEWKMAPVARVKHGVGVLDNRWCPQGKRESKERKREKENDDTC